MESSKFAPLGKSASALGFGCASVGSRYGRRESLRAMATAFDAGVSYFDVARSYGYGEAEAIVGQFIRDKRDRVVVASKFGVDPPKSSSALRLAKGVARKVFALAPRLRSIAAPSLGGQFTPRRFDVAGMRRSVETTLRQLRTERVDVLHIHDGTRDALEDDALFRALEDLVVAGKVGCLGMTGERATVLEGVRRRPSLRVAQYAHELFAPRGALPERPEGVATVVHHPFGGGAGIARLRTVVERLAKDDSAPDGLRRRLRETARDEAIAAIAFASARRADLASVVLTAMFTPTHMAANARASASASFSDDEWGFVERALLDDAPR